MVAIVHVRPFLKTSKGRVWGTGDQNRPCPESFREDWAMEALMDLLDVDGSATISYPEFIAAMTDRKHYTTDATCLAVFQIFDTNGDGHINRHELQQALKSKTFKDLDFNLFPAIEEARVDAVYTCSCLKCGKGATKVWMLTV
ncbi:Calcium-dependent protein kinase 22 [Durusdinium trenchii]|uniref:Calcium-dependent protein kinase 22 n=1 Tax=Durusdinium trenchii TaxID=1381693 RepID=A0ABP0SI99_9DINO